VNMVASPIVLALAVIGFGVLIARMREMWRTRRELSKKVHRQRIRFGVLSLSLVGLGAIFVVQVAHLPLWMVDVGGGLIFASWAGYIILSVVFGFLEGFSEVIDQRSTSQHHAQSEKDKGH